MAPGPSLRSRRRPCPRVRAPLAAFLLAPGLIALLLDHEPGKPIARAVLLTGLAGALPPLLRLWHLGAGLDSALSLLGDPTLLGAVWLLGAGGWLLNAFAPLLLGFALERRAKMRAARLTAERARIVEAWDLETEAEDQAAMSSS